MPPKAKANNAAAELDKQQRLRNLYQLERDRIIQFWQITKDEIEKQKAATRLMERDKEEAEERYNLELKAYKSKLRQLMAEQQAERDAVLTETARLLRTQRDELAKDDAEVNEAHRDLTLAGKEAAVSHSAQYHHMKMRFDSDITAELQKIEASLRQQQIRYDRKARVLRETLDALRVTDVTAAEKRIAAHVEALMCEHDAAFHELRSYYADITTSNLELIKTLKEQVFEMRKNERYNERLMFDVALQNKRLTEPLTQSMREVSKLSHELSDLERDRAELQRTQSALVAVESHHHALRWKHEVLTQRFEHLETEYRSISKRFSEALEVVQQKSSLQAVLLRRKLDVASSNAEAKTAQLSEVLAASGVHADALAPVQSQVDGLESAKGETIQLLTNQIEALVAQHDRVVRAYEEHLAKHNIAGLRSD